MVYKMGHDQVSTYLQASKYQYHAYIRQKFKEYFIAPSVHVAMNVDEYPVSLLQEYTSGSVQ